MQEILGQSGLQKGGDGMQSQFMKYELKTGQIRLSQATELIQIAEHQIGTKTDEENRVREMLV